MKIGIIGFGYWGNILYKNLIELGFDNIIICDKLSNSNLVNFKNYHDLINQDIKFVFIATTAIDHYEIVKFFLENDVNVFCEKPLTLNYHESRELYHIANKKKLRLFVDWIFTFNKSIHYIKFLVDKLQLTPLNIVMNRLNKGPVRTDTDAKYDLSSHDLSILFYLFNEKESNNNLIKNFKILDFKRDLTSIQNDSSIIILNYSNFNVQINSSWQYGYKERLCIFQFEEGFIYWDDSKQSVDISINLTEDLLYNCFNSKNLIYNNPLKDSIFNFINNENFDYETQENITLKINAILEEKYAFI